MKQFVQNSKILRAMAVRLFSAAIIVTAPFTFNIQAQANPGQGAVVTFIHRDGSGLWRLSNDEYLLEIVTGGEGSFLRQNPDGTLSIQITIAQTPMVLSVNVAGEWVPMASGVGTFHVSSLVEQSENGGVNDLGEASHIDAHAQLASLVDDSPLSLQVVVELQNGELKALKVAIQQK